MKRRGLQTVGEKAQGRSSKVSSSTQSEHRASSEEGKDVCQGSRGGFVEGERIELCSGGWVFRMGDSGKGGMT